MGGGVARHALDRHCGVDKLPHLRVAIVHLLELGRLGQRQLQGHVQLVRDGLCDCVRFGIGHVERAADVAHGAAGCHGAEGHDLGNLVLAVFAGHVVDDLSPALLAEVGIKVRHRDAFGIQEALENEGILHRVDLGDVHTVCRNGGGAGTSARSDRDAVLLCPADEIGNDQVVVHIAHPLDDSHLVSKPVAVFLRRVRIALGKALAAHPAEVIEGFRAVRGLEMRQMVVVELKFDVAALRDLRRVLEGLVQLREARAKLLLRLDVEFVGGELQAVGLVDGLAGLDAEQDVLHNGVLAAQIVGVVRDDQRQASLPGELQQHRVDLCLLGQAVVLQLEIEIVRAEDTAVFQRDLLRAIVIIHPEPARNRAGETCRERNQAVRVLAQQVHINARLAVEALKEAH